MRFQLCLASIAVAFASAPVLATEPVPPDNVTCINTAMTPEDREIALVMFAESTMHAPVDDAAPADAMPEKGEDHAPPYASEQLAEVFELLEEAHMRCLDLYPWNSGQSEASRMYAFLSIIGEAIGKTLKLEAMEIATLDGFYDANKKKFTHRNQLTVSEKIALKSHLQAASWAVEDQALVDMATDYAETLMMKEMLRRAFDTGDFSKLEFL